MDETESRQEPTAAEGGETAAEAAAGPGDGAAADAAADDDETAAPPTAAAEATEATDTADAGFERRHPHALRLEMAVGGAVLGGLTLLALVGTALPVLFVPLPVWPVLAALVLPLALVFPLLVVPRWRHRHYLYRVDERGLELRKGIWWRSHRLIPHTRLQHTDVTQGPLERQFGLATLIVHTAGTHEARTAVSGLSIATARRLRDRLTDADAGNGGNDGV